MQKKKPDLDKGDSIEFLQNAWGATPEELEAYANPPKRPWLQKFGRGLVNFAGVTAITFVFFLFVLRGAGVTTFIKFLPFVAVGYITYLLITNVLVKLLSNEE